MVLQQQTTLFLLCMVLGCIMGLVYDLLRIVRRMVKHAAIWIQCEDFLYWICAAWFVFAALLQKNHGQIRFFILLGIFGGWYLYHSIASQFVIRIGQKLIHIFQKLLLLLLEIICTPIRLLLLPLRKPMYRCKKYLHSLRLYVRIKKDRLQRDIRFFRHKSE